MDIAQLVPAPQAVINLMHPVTGQPLTTTDGQTQHIKGYGSDSRQYKAALNDNSRRIMEFTQDKGVGYTLTTEEQAEMAGKFLADVITEVLYEDGDGVHTDVKRFCTDNRMTFWHDQVYAELGRRTNFMPA